MPSVWDAHFGFVQQKTGRAILVGEWGGTYEGVDKLWQQAAAAYFAERGIGSFYYCLNPGSLDTGGLLEHDWVTRALPPPPIQLPPAEPAQSRPASSVCCAAAPQQAALSEHPCLWCR